MDRMKMVESTSAVVERSPNFVGEVIDKMIGTYKVELIRDGKVIETREGKNTIMTVGKNSLLDVTFRAQSQITVWYIGLVDNASFSAFSAADTMGSHAGWIENQDYSESTRVSWTGSLGAASAGSITNSTALTFTINANSKTIKGIFATSVSTKGGTTGTLWNGVAFSSTIAVNSGDLLKVTYTVSC